MALEEINRKVRMPEAWLLVWAGPGAWKARVFAVLDTIEPDSDRAHHILSHEVDGECWSLLLVHDTAAERDEVVAQLRREWHYGFVNAVLDLDES
jgi:hypothetical protein